MVVVLNALQVCVLAEVGAAGMEQGEVGLVWARLLAITPPSTLATHVPAVGDLSSGKLFCFLDLGSQSAESGHRLEGGPGAGPVWLPRAFTAEPGRSGSTCESPRSHRTPVSPGTGLLVLLMELNTLRNL